MWPKVKATCAIRTSNTGGIKMHHAHLRGPILIIMGLNEAQSSRKYDMKRQPSVSLTSQGLNISLSSESQWSDFLPWRKMLLVYGPATNEHGVFVVHIT